MGQCALATWAPLSKDLGGSELCFVESVEGELLVRNRGLMKLSGNTWNSILSVFRVISQSLIKTLLLCQLTVK